jgi:hypothetical protein
MLAMEEKFTGVMRDVLDGKSDRPVYARLEGMQGPPRLAASANAAATVTVRSLTMAVQLFEYVESVRQTAGPSRGTSQTDLSNLPYVFLQILYQIRTLEFFAHGSVEFGSRQSVLSFTHRTGNGFEP